MVRVQELSRSIKNCQEVTRIVKKYQEVSRGIRKYQEVSKSIKKYQELSKSIQNCLKFESLKSSPRSNMVVMTPIYDKNIVTLWKIPVLGRDESLPLCTLKHINMSSPLSSSWIYLAHCIHFSLSASQQILRWWNYSLMEHYKSHDQFSFSINLPFQLKTSALPTFNFTLSTKNHQFFKLDQKK